MELEFKEKNPLENESRVWNSVQSFKIRLPNVSQHILIHHQANFAKMIEILVSFGPLLISLNLST